MSKGSGDSVQAAQSSGSKPDLSSPSVVSAKSSSRGGLASVARLVKLGRCKNVVVVAGAGISTASGIPDFRLVFFSLSTYNCVFFFPVPLLRCKSVGKHPGTDWLKRDIEPLEYFEQHADSWLLLNDSVSIISSKCTCQKHLDFFRTPGTGLYANLEKYNIPYPEAIFNIDYFSNDPQPFFSLAKALYPGSHRPNYIHYFIRMLHHKGLLLRMYTQNIDGLEKGE